MTFAILEATAASEIATVPVNKKKMKEWKFLWKALAPVTALHIFHSFLRRIPLPSMLEKGGKYIQKQ